MAISGDFLIFGTAFGFCALLCVLLARWYVWPRVARMPRHEALILLLWPHTSRFLNLAAATVQQVDSRIPHAWTLEIAWGDFLAAVFALGAIFALRRRADIALPLTWWATIFGLADFANSLGQGIALNVTDLPMRAVWYIAAGLVPPLITLHILAIGVLRRAAKRAD
jgi:hypothetical protein